MLTGRPAFLIGIIVGLVTWFALLGIVELGGNSVERTQRARSLGEDIALPLVLVAVVVYWKERSFTRTVWTGFFFGFTIAFGGLAIPTGPSF